MPVPLIIVVSPAITPAFSSMMVAVTSVVTYSAIKIDQLVDWISSSPEPTLTIEDKKSLQRQHEMTKKRRLDAEKVAEHTRAIANNTNLEFKRLENTATLIIMASQTVANVSEVLTQTTKENMDAQEKFTKELTDNIERHEVITNMAESIPGTLDALTKALSDKTALIESLHEKLAISQAQAAEHEIALQQMNEQISGLVTLNQSQADAIHMLQTQKTELIKNIKEMATELELLAGSDDKSANTMTHQNRFFC